MKRAVVTVLLLLGACGGGDPTGPGGPDAFTYSEPWPNDVAPILTTVFVDGQGDQEALPPEMAGPPYSGVVRFPSVDVVRVAMGIEGDFLFMRVDFAGQIPTDVVHIPQNGEVEEQWVHNQGMNVSVNSDGDLETGGGGEGVSGVDIFFAVSFDFGVRSQIYANYGFPTGDLHEAQGEEEAELGQGGPGYTYAIVRYRIADIRSYVPAGATVEVGAWSEAESFDAAGSLKYHHFAFDRVIDHQTWTIQ
jgi:hypothetical protein